jgi:xylulose-5-phosphate/fructose-6-phosphate phosphoketolase
VQLLPRLGAVRSVVHGRFEVAEDELDGVQGQAVGEVAGVHRDVRLGGVGQGVEAAVGGDGSGKVGGQQRVDDGDAGGQGVVGERVLLAAGGVGDDGEAETGPLAASWHSNKFLDPVNDGAVLPILHLNGYKIANPTILARLPQHELDNLLHGYGHDPIHVTGDDPLTIHHAMAHAMDTALDRITTFQHAARNQTTTTRPHWPMIILRTPKGWTGPTEVDGLPIEGTWRAHQVPLTEVRTNPEHLRQLEDWLHSYRPTELFDTNGHPRPQVLACIPHGTHRIGTNPHTNGGLLLRDLPLPELQQFAVPVDIPGSNLHEPTRVLGTLLEKIMADTADRRNFRLVGPDETASNRLQNVYKATGKAWQAGTLEVDEHLDPHGRVMEILSEHTCQGWLEGYLLTGRHGLFSCYEAFIHIIDSMVNQHIKWLRTTQKLPWRQPIASLNYLLTSHVWRQDHNGFSHQDPGFIDHILNKAPEVVRVYLPPDTNTLLSVAEHVLASRNYVNVIVAGKQPCFDWLSMDAARAHCARGAGLWEFAGTEDVRRGPDVVLACAGDVPTLEVLAAAQLLRRHLPRLAVRVVNIVDLALLMPHEEHPHGMTDPEYDALFTPDKPVIFAYHGYPWLIHRLAYRRTGHTNLHVRGYKEIGTTTTPFDMVLRNDLDRYRLVMDVIDRVPGLAVTAAAVRQRMEEVRLRHHSWIREHGTDLPEVADWSWEG